ncbi:fibronectin type III domain-containing protein [Paenibacillus sp. RU5M]|uniref:fibronectin type III domain-containing protein n=1 Tax=Paenibacillus sp. RU5M TaxID=1907396 RepID=UPI00117BE24E|nr:fibronectin type III domain-containing protein [Paenibacillus sp. RU5M]
MKERTTVGAGKRKNGFYLWTVRLLVLMLVFGQFGVYGGNRAHAATSSRVVSSNYDYRYVLSEQDGNLSVNQKPIDLGWARSYSFSATGYSFSRMQSVRGTVPKMTNVSFGSYTSTYAGKINNAILIDFSEVWHYYTVMEYRQSGTNVGGWNISHVDEFGYETPRYVQSYEASQLSLVVNADTGTVVDFVSDLNPYYTRKAESFSFVKETGTKVPITTVPSIPVDIVAAANDVAINLNWSAAQQAVQYEIEENGVVKGPYYGVNYTSAPFKPNTTYTYKVRGVNPRGVSEWSTPYTLRTLLEKPVLTVTAEESKNTVKWKSVEYADRYQLQIDGGTPIELGNVTTYEHEGLAANSTHTYVLKAFSPDNESTWSKPLSQLTVPDRADGLKITDATFNKLSISWTAVKGATGYDLEIDGTIVAVTGTTYSKTGLTANTEHTFRIRPKNTGGVGSWSDKVIGFTQLSTPVIQSSSSEEEVVLVWAPIEGATSYEVEADGVVFGDIENPIFSHTALTSGTAHKYRVRALNDANNSAWTTVITQNTLPSLVSGLTVSAVTNAAITLKWNAVTGATGYDLEIDGTPVALTATSYTKSALAGNTEHTFRIRSKNAAGAGAWSEVVTGRTQFNLPVPKASSEETAITLTWPSIPDATAYEVEADGAVVATVNEPTYTHGNLLPGTSHKYRVRVATDTNTSAWTAIVTQSTLPSAVMGLGISSVTNTAIVLKWSTVTGASGYDLEVDGTVVPVTGLTYTKSGLAANTEHTFRIRSKNTAGVGTWSDVISGTTQLNTPVLKANSEETAVVLTWANVADATKYEIEADGINVATVTDLKYVHEGLLAGTSHKYRVRALTDTNAGAWTAILTQNTLPGSVTGLSVTSATNVAIALKWNAVTGATGYDLEIDGNVVAVSGLTYTKTGLVTNTEHTFRIRSKNTAGVGAWSDIVDGTTQLNTPVVKASSEETSITLTWAEVTGATKYEIEADGVITGTVNESKYVHNSLLAGTAHKYRVRALTDTNMGAWTAILSQNTLPGSVAGLSVTSVTNAAIALKWNAVTGATGYDLEIDGNVVAVSGLTYTKTGLLANTDHTFRIRSKNAAGVGTWSEAIEGLTQLNTPVLKASSEETSITVTWIDVTDATKYEVEADGIIVGTVNESKYVHMNLLPGTAHKYRIRALTETNTGAWTALLTQNTLPAVVTGLSITSATNAAIALKWNAVTGATAYDLEIDGTVVAVSGLVYTKSGLGTNTEHVFRIRSKNAAGVGAWSETITGITLLNTPVLKVSSEETTITLTWPEIKEATKYEIEADGIIVGTVNDPIYIHSNLLAGTTHKYRVRSLTNTNVSAWTAIVTQNTLPGAVTGLSVTSVTNTTIALKWNAVTGATGYDLEIDGTLVPVSGLTYTKTGLVANTDHTFRIRSKNAAGVGAWGDVTGVATQLNTPVLKASSEESAIHLTWIEIKDATKYEIEADGTVIASVTESMFTHKGLLPGTAHKYRVRALTDTNTSAWTALLTQNTLPDAVTGFMLNTATPAAISLKWNAVLSASGYDLEIDNAITPVSGVTYTKSGLAANTEHTFRIRAKNASGTGAWTEVVIASTQLNVPTLKTTSEETAITLTWTEVAGATKYEIEADGTVVATVSDLMYVHNGLLGGTIHKYRIRALTDTNTSAWTAIYSPITLPAVVSGLSMNTKTATAVSVKWNAATGANGYDLEVDGVIIAATGTVYTRNGLTANTEHTFRIRAKNATGAGAWSENLTVTTQLATPVLRGAADKNNVTLTWDAINGATSYVIEDDGKTVATVSESTWVHIDLLPSSLHKYRIIAVNDQNTSIWSSVVSIRTLN